MRNQRTTRQRNFSVSVARSAWVIGRAGSCLRQAACPQEGRRPATGWHEDAVGRARMEMHMVIERRSEAVQKGDGTESRASRARPVTVTGRARRSTKQSLYSRDQDSREGCDRAWAVSEEAAQSLRHGDHPLPHGHRGSDAVDEMRSCLRHSAAIARRADTPALAREGHDKILPARRTSCPAEGQEITLELGERLGGVGVKRGHSVEEQTCALKLRERLGGVGVERGQTVEVQLLALELRQQCLGLFRRQAFDLVRVFRQLVCQCATRAEQRKRDEDGGDKDRQASGGLLSTLLPCLLPRLKPFGDHEVFRGAAVRLLNQLQRLDQRDLDIFLLDQSSIGRAAIV